MAKANKKKKNNSVKPTVQNENPKQIAETEQVLDNQPAETETVDVAETSNASQSAKVVKEQPKKDKKDKPKKDKSAKQSNPKQNKVKETVAELKKVTWPTFPQVVKNTLLVIIIVLISTIVLFGIDYGLSWLYKLLTPAA